MQLGILIVRVLVLMAATAAGFALAHGLGLHAPSNFFLGGAGFLAGVLVVLLEWQARRIPVDRLFWGAVGAMLGVVLGPGRERSDAGASRCCWATWPPPSPSPSGTSSRTCRSSSSPRPRSGRKATRSSTPR